jgi:Protein of unknown function (Hypoth_ymh)
MMRLVRVRTQFHIGEYELAAFAAMREVEIRIRELIKTENSLIGVKLMRDAFKPENGPPADSDLDPDEKVAMMEPGWRLYSVRIMPRSMPPQIRPPPVYRTPTSHVVRCRVGRRFGPSARLGTPSCQHGRGRCVPPP